MQEILGVPVVIDNKPGGGTNIGLGATARADADGYTIGLSTSGSSSILVYTSVFRSIR
jgi:tripartite-type tricarboxylate transporter receptor subunit TctC